MDIPVVSNQRTLVLLEMTKNYIYFLAIILLPMCRSREMISRQMTMGIEVIIQICMNRMFKLDEIELV